MEKTNKIFLKLLIVLLSFISVDGAGSFVFDRNDLQLLMSHEHHNDAELPHNHHNVNLTDDEKWIEPGNNHFFSSILILDCVPDDHDSPTGEFSGPIWQPPKFL